MSSESILFIVIAGIIAFALSVFMYGFKSKYSKKLKWILGSLRFITLFAILLLLINPKFKSETYTIVKPKLNVLIDNSQSINELNQSENTLQLVSKIKNNDAIQRKFDVSYFPFGNDLKLTDSLNFSDKNTNISKALQAIQELSKNEIAPTLLITDGNQTFGSDYEFAARTFKNAIFPVILGDSTQYTDLRIEQLNTNKYAFLKNQFPIEVVLVYSGKDAVNTQFIVTQNGNTVYREAISFTNDNVSKTLNFTLPATAVGLQKYTAQIIALDDEKNKVNNLKQFAVEVIDQATSVLIVSKISHPDIGLLKSSISTNEQRTVSVKKPTEALAALANSQLVILYQPDASFSSIFSTIKEQNKNTFVVSGLATDWNFLNTAQTNFFKSFSNQTEDVQALFNSNYGTFGVEDLGFENYRPLKTSFGSVKVLVPHEILLQQTINGFKTESAMLATMELNGKRDAIWDGEGIWKWRAQSYLDNNTFQPFDDFMGKLIQYLASNKKRSRLEVSNESFYYNNNPITISAQYFDQNFIFNPKSALTISVTNAETKIKTVFPMLLKNNFYEVDLNSLSQGEYSYTVAVQDEALSKSGNFTILDFNVEQQFLNADVAKLKRTGQQTGGSAYFITQSDKLLQDLIENDTFTSVQKSEQKTVPLVDWKYLLLLLIISLSAEWFIRKYNGLI